MTSEMMYCPQVLIISRVISDIYANMRIDILIIEDAI